MAKVKLPREVAEAIEGLREIGYKDGTIIVLIVKRETDCVGISDILYFTRRTPCGVDAIMDALVNGYETERTPEEKLREYYDELIGTCDMEAVECTVEILAEKYPELGGVLDGETTKNPQVKCPKCGGEMVSMMAVADTDRLPVEIQSCQYCGYERRDDE